MTDVLAPPEAGPAELRSRAPWVAALGAAGWSALAGLALLTAPVLVAWLVSGADAPLASPLRLGADLWLVAQHVPLQLPTAELTLTPWGLSIPVVVLLHRAGRWAAAASGVPDAPSAARLVGGLAATYAVVGAVVAGVAGSPDRMVDPRAAGAATGLLALLAGGSGVLAEGGRGVDGWWALPARFRTWVRAGAAAAAALVAGGGALVVIALLVHAGRVGRLTGSLEAGFVGGLLVAGLGAALLPNAAVWAASYAAGPGFVVGAGSSVAPGEVRLGPLPALPVLAGLPSASHGALDWLVLVAPLAAGVLAALVLRRAAPVGDLVVDAGPEDSAADSRPGPADGPGGRARRAADHLLDAAATGLVAGLVLGVLALLSGGAAGPGRLGVVGPFSLTVALVVAAEVALVVLLVSPLLSLRRDRSTPV